MQIKTKRKTKTSASWPVFFKLLPVASLSKMKYLCCYNKKKEKDSDKISAITTENMHAIRVTIGVINMCKKLTLQRIRI